MQTTEEAVNLLLEAGVPACPINTIEMVTKDPHIAVAREMFIDIDHPVAGKTKLTGTHIKMMGHDKKQNSPSPYLGQHNNEVYTELLNITEEDVQKLQKDGVI